jgi:hypothetical protein
MQSSSVVGFRVVSVDRVVVDEEDTGGAGFSVSVGYG